MGEASIREIWVKGCVQSSTRLLELSAVLYLDCYSVSSVFFIVPSQQVAEDVGWNQHRLQGLHSVAHLRCSIH